VRLRNAASLRILDFDIENRPLSYLGMDFTTSDITSIAAGWADEKKVYCWALGEVTTEAMLEGFLGLYDQADVVTGHFIRGHDLPIINGALAEFGYPPLTAKLTSDTKNDLVKRKGVSASQESLADMLGVSAPKIQMSQAKWRSANRLTAAGIAETKRRVIGDIRQHKQLRVALIAAGLLGPPRFNVFGFMHGEREDLDLNRRGIPAWRLHDAIDYFVSRGFDGILIERRTDTAVFGVPSVSIMDDEHSFSQ